jgi:hypothetical protein
LQRKRGGGDPGRHVDDDELFLLFLFGSYCKRVIKHLQQYFFSTENRTYLHKQAIFLCVFFSFFFFGSSCKPVIVASAAVFCSPQELRSYTSKLCVCVCSFFFFLLRSCCTPVTIASGAIFFSTVTENTYTRKLSLSLFFLFSFWSLSQGSSSSSINSTFFYTGTNIRYASKLSCSPPAIVLLRAQSDTSPVPVLLFFGGRLIGGEQAIFVSV